MKRHTAWLLACSLLAGCGPSPIDEPPATPSGGASSAGTDGDADTGGAGASDNTDASDRPAAFHFESGVLEIGDFDPYTLGDNIFDPCTEITPEEFAAAGFENVEPIDEKYAGLTRGLSACTFSKHEDILSEGFSSNNANRWYIESQLELLEYSSETVQSIFVYGPKNEIGTSCYAQIDTLQGGIVAQVAGLEGHDYQERTCEVAVENLEHLYFANAD